ncbi:hypothetical protein [Actinokineospora sp.]|uniref:hypothetical protein n=1 Tax=Actinokineospora sp. TaxID=1872133 RepID=UPI004037DC09
MRTRGRGYFVEGLLLGLGAAASLTVAVRFASAVWAVIGMLLAGVAIACLAASLRRRAVVSGTVPAPRKQRRLGVRGRFGSSPEAAVLPAPERPEPD